MHRLRKVRRLGRCVFNDALYNEVREKLAGADALVVGSPVYYAGPNGSLCALLDRLFYSCSDRLAYKPAAAVAVWPPGRGERDVRPAEQVFHDFKHARRVVAILEQRPREAARARRRRTPKGAQTMRVLARNMARMLRAGLLASEGRPEPEERVVTSFIR